MQDWKKELDALVAETLAFVKAVNPSPLTPVNFAAPPANLVRDHSENAVIPQSDPPAPAGDDPTVEDWPLREREEIRRRLASFKAHQERWIKERADYASSTMSRIKPQSGH